MVVSDPSSPRFVYWDNKLHALPSGLGEFVGFDLLSCSGKFRALTGALGLVDRKPAGDESVKDFFTRHLGKIFIKITPRMLYNVCYRS